MTSEKQAGFSLLEVIVSTAILFSVAGAFLSMTCCKRSPSYQGTFPDAKCIRTV